MITCWVHLNIMAVLNYNRNLFSQKNSQSSSKRKLNRPYLYQQQSRKRNSKLLSRSNPSTISAERIGSLRPESQRRAKKYLIRTVACLKSSLLMKMALRLRGLSIKKQLNSSSSESTRPRYTSLPKGK